eukprot:2793837-Prymnesium_polylepis.1
MGWGEGLERALGELRYLCSERRLRAGPIATGAAASERDTGRLKMSTSCSCVGFSGGVSDLRDNCAILMRTGLAFYR